MQEVPMLSLKATALPFAIVASAAIALAGCKSRSNDDVNSIVLPAAELSPKDQFESKFKEIQLDMSEEQVDQILAGYPCQRRDLLEYEKEHPPNPYGHWKLKRKGSFAKTYDCKPRANEGDFYIQVYFDENYSVVGKLMGEYIS